MDMLNDVDVVNDADTMVYDADMMGSGDTTGFDMASDINTSNGVDIGSSIDMGNIVRDNLSALTTGEATIESVAKVLWINACSLANIERTSELENFFIEILNKYKEGIFDENTIIDLFQKVATGNMAEAFNYVATYTSELEEYVDESTDTYYGGGGGGGSSSKKSSETIVDIDYERLNSFISKYDELEKELNSIEITIPPLLESYAGSISAIVQNGKSESTGYLSELKQSLVEILNITAETDQAIKDIELGKISFKDLSSVVYDRSQSSEVRMVTESVFKNLGYTPDESGFITINGCKYNVKNHKFYNGNDEAFEAYFYMPQNALTNGNYNELNTYTFFSEKGYHNLIDNCSSNSVLLRITKYPADKQFTKLNEVSLATKFMNQVVGTGTSTSGTGKACRNIIAGDSSYGANALKVAAQSGDLYQTVYCVNNAAIVGGEGGNGHPGTKNQFATLEDLKGLNGKDIYFISAPGDENLNHCYTGKKWAESVTSYDNSYTYKGIELICQNCPEARVHFIINESQMKGKETQLIDLYKNLETKYNNFSYDSSEWNNLTDPSYRYHSSGHNIVYDAANWSVTNVVPETTTITA